MIKIYEKLGNVLCNNLEINTELGIIKKKKKKCIKCDRKHTCIHLSIKRREMRRKFWSEKG